jgi:Domain of unknown function (DUF4350)
MPLDPGDRKLLIFSGSLLVVLTVAALLLSPAEEVSFPGFPSSYSTAGNGAKAAYLLLGEMDYRIERWTSPPADLPEHPQNTVLIVAGPVIPPSSEETLKLRYFVARGGRLLTTGAEGASLISLQGPQYELGQSGKWLKSAALEPGPLTRNAPEIEMKGGTHWTALRESQRRYYGDQRGATVVECRIGKGEVIWWADDSPLTNYGLTQASNLMLLLNSVGPPTTARVLWDEYYHGQRLGFWDYLGRTPAPWALLQFLALAVFVVVTFARRSGPVRPLGHESRLSPLEFVEALGALYERKGAAAGALEIAVQRFRYLLTRRLGLPATAATAELVRGVRDRLGWTVPGFAETIQGIDTAVRLQNATESDAVQWVGELYDYSQRFGLEVGISSGRGPAAHAD